MCGPALGGTVCTGKGDINGARKGVKICLPYRVGLTAGVKTPIEVQRHQTAASIDQLMPICRGLGVGGGGWGGGGGVGYRGCRNEVPSGRGPGCMSKVPRVTLSCSCECLRFRPYTGLY